MKEFIKELIERIKSESPDFFKKIGRIGMFLVAFSTGIFGFEYFGNLPEIYTTTAGHLAGIGLTITLIANLTKKDKEKEDV